MTVSVEQFRAAVVSAGLLTADEFAAHCRALPTTETPADGEAVAKSLIGRQALTEFQAGVLLTGSPTPLVLGKSGKRW